MYTYFVAYFFVNGLGQNRMGNDCLKLPFKISAKSHIRHAEQMLVNRNPHHMYIAITNWELLEEHEAICIEENLQRRGEATC